IYQNGILTQYRNGTPIGTASHTFATGASGIRLGEELNGNRNQAMDVAEILVYDRAVTETDRAQIGAYLENRYGLSSGGNFAPTVVITSPEEGAVIRLDELPVTLTATATDPEDGNIGDDILWSSDVEGPLG